MPSQITHVLAGRAALRESGPLFGLPGKAPVLQAFNLGCQGPDIFSHNRRTKPLGLMYSRLLHRQDFGRFCATAAGIFIEDPEPHLFSWLYGFITHQAVDRIFHPYIVNRSYVSQSTGIPGVSPALFHAFLERIIDVTLLSILEGIPVSCFNTGTLFLLDDEEIRTLSDGIAVSLAHTYPENEDTDDMRVLRVQNAFTDSMYFYELTNPVMTAYSSSVARSMIGSYEDLGAGGVALMYPEKPDPEVDWLNLAHESWEHPITGKRTTLSVPDMFSQAVEIAARTVECASRVLSGDISPSELERLIGNGCLSVSGDDGKIAQVRFAKPFDLSRALLAECDKRREWIHGTLS